MIQRSSCFHALCLFTNSVVVSAFSAVAMGQGVTSERLEQLLQPLAKAHAGEVAASVCVLNESGEVTCRWDYRSDVPMPTASLIKLPVMIEAYRQAEAGLVSLDDLLLLKEEDQVPGSGILTEHFSPGLQLPLRDAIRLMIRYSDNTATNLVIDRIGLPATTRFMTELGMPETQLHSKVFRRDTSLALPRSERFGLGSTTAGDMTELLVRLNRGQLVSPTASQAMLAHLRTCDDTAKLPRELPPGVQIAHKTGSVNRSRTAAGLISSPGVRFAICVLTDQNQDASWSDDNAAHVLIGQLASLVYRELNSDAAVQNSGSNVAAPTDSSLRIGAIGERVESLQRTLNDRIGAGLGVDGDFGPATESAVRKFQASRSLEATGVVDEATWEALGPLIERDPPVPPPAEVNARTFEQSAPLNPFAPPAVTAKAWAAMNVQTGELIGSLHPHQRLPIASTTKVMTALLVAELAAKDPAVLEEVIEFSERADQTLGSTAGVRAGEQLTIGELLYGLMLPSGNDASVALAEYCGPRCAEALGVSGADASSSASYDQFVAAMNARAKQLDLSDTHFTNPNGLTEAEHLSSAADLARLAQVALSYPLLREIMQCRERGAQVRRADGATRNLLWVNTNRLLSQAGFLGMKTGTTEAAGACLIAVGRPENQSMETIVIVLGSESSDARYVDARNLFAWAWRQ